jgi:hypothetical protein
MPPDHNPAASFRDEDDMTETARKDPVVTLAPPASETPEPAVAAPVAAIPLAERGNLDQLTRIEDKAARIEEKYARSEALLLRVEGAVDRAVGRLEETARDMNLTGLREDFNRLERRVRTKPGIVTLFVVALVAALIGAGVTVAASRYGVPGLPPAP